MVEVIVRETKEVIGMKRTGALIAALCIGAVALSGCAEKVSGSPVTDAGAAGALATITGGSSAVAQRVSPLSAVTCQQLVAGTGGTECLVKPPVVTSSAKKVELHMGDPVAFTTSGRTSVVSVGAFVRDSGGTTYAVVGSPVPPASAGDAVTATDGTPLGTTAKTVETAVTGESWEVAVIKLAENVKAVSAVSGVAATPENVAVTFTGAGTTTPTSGTLVHGGDTFYFPVPTMHAGDNGGPIVVGDRLAGLVSITGGSAVAWSKIAPRLTEVGAVHLLTK